ncbi:hypothetical protein Xsto_03773 [Xenorhabdus stockiae]|uniref:Uncharacterized protein n=1 Tax=Xenorhabdus stockiae TaxID=351614 RepID=A0A2D0KBC1_9GAMM|nr:hypothetical protein [Xenorhabdus stockiae]PHM60662.1 hypothetical protein Xsto_03773 [Xenorhabdus stockiae]
MIIILGPMIYVIGFIAAFIISTLIERRESNPESFSFILLMSFLWPVLVVLAPIVFGLLFLKEKYDQFVGRQS